ncbi:MAG TPA: hypothetical protein PK595_06865 [Bacteroidota bacterium]|nr:hypothetical protein [Bacteroidota bacterium]
MKKAIYYEEAKRMYVNDGLSLDVIVKLLKDNVSRKTLYNWKMENNWDKQREEYLHHTASLQNELMEIARTTVKNAKENPTPHNIYAMLKALGALKLINELPGNDSTENLPKNIKPETIEAIEKEILGL